MLKADGSDSDSELVAVGDNGEPGEQQDAESAAGSGGLKRSNSSISDDSKSNKAKGSNKSKKKAKKSKGKNRGKKSGQGGRPTTTKNGEKRCNECGKMKSLTEFKPHNSVCTTPCLNMKDNITNACKVLLSDVRLIH